MADEVTKRGSHKRLWIEITIGVCLLAIVLGLVWYVRSPGFADLVHRKVVQTIEEATGGRVEMASFRWNLARMEFEAHGLTIHGLETQDQLPYAHVDRARIKLHIISFLERQVSLRQVELQHPVIHVIVNPDGSTNAPEPKVKVQSNENVAQQLLDLAVGRVDIHDGMLVINDRKLPMDFSANDLLASMTYFTFDKRYDANVKVGKIDLKYGDFRDLPASVDTEFSLWRNSIAVKSLRLTSQQSTVQATGKLTDFEKPQLEVTYDSTVDLGQVGAVVREAQLRAGTLQLNGTASYSEAAGPALRGRIAFRDLDYIDNGLVLRKANANSNFSFSNDRLLLTRIATRMMGGEITGDADIKNLAPSMAPKPETAVLNAGKSKGKRQPVAGRVGSLEQEGTARLHVTGVSLNELTHAFSSRSMPLDKLNAVGRMKGSVDVAWNLKTLTLLMVPSHWTSVTGPMRPIIPGAATGSSAVWPSSVWPLVTVNRLVPSLFILFIKPAVDEDDSPRTATMAATPIAMPRADRPARSLRVRMPTADRRAMSCRRRCVAKVAKGYSCPPPWRPEEAAGGGPSETTKPSSNRTTRLVRAATPMSWVMIAMVEPGR